MWIRNLGKFPSFCTDVLKMCNFAWIPLAILVDWAIFRTFLDLTKIWIRWNFLKDISENSLPKGSFWRNKRKSEFSDLLLNSPYLQTTTLKNLKATILKSIITWSETALAKEVYWAQCIDGFCLLLQRYVRKDDDAKNPAILSFFFATEITQSNAART